MAWVLLVVAGLLEVGWSLGLKGSAGFTRPVASLVTAVVLLASVLLLARATHELPIGTAYAVWVGIGVIGSSVGGVLLFGEAMTPLRSVFLGLLLLSIVGLKLTTHAAS